MSTTHNSTYGSEEIVVVSGRGNIQYGQVPAWILLSQDAHACRVYAILSLFKNHNDDVVYPGLDWIAGALGVTKTEKISKHIDKLVACGAVHRERGRSADGLRTRNRYTLHWLPPEGYEGPMSTRDVVKASKSKNQGSDVHPPERGVGRDQQKHASPQVASIPPQGGYVPPKGGGSVPPEGGGLSKPKRSKPNESKTKKNPPVGVDERSVREPAVRTHEDPIEESPDFVPHADRVAVEMIQEQFAAEPAPDVETAQGGGKKQKNPNHYDTAAELLREAFAGVDTGDAADTVKRKRILVDALAKKLAAGVTKQAARDNLDRLSAAKSPLGAAMYRIESLKPVTGATGEPRPDWCGQCPETTRMVYSEDKDRMARCPNCHPKANDPERRSPISGYDDDDVTWKKDIEAQREFSRKIREDIQRQKERRKNQQAAM